jgi:hypothetical protein
MRIGMKPSLVAAGCAMLAACGGGSGGGVNSAPMPIATAPAPNSALADLHSNQSFDTNSASATATFDLAADQVTSGTSAPSSIQVNYDAAAKSYTVATTGRSETFTPGEIQAGTLPGETRYLAGQDLLTLVTTPYSGTIPNQYVGMGYWQRNALSGTTQNTTFDSFVYGFATPAGAVPRTGSAGYITDVFGLYTVPGKEPKAISGAGTFQVDLLQGIFQTKAFVNEFALTSDTFGSGGTIVFQGAGHLTSGNGFSGNVSYSGFNGTVAGTMSGRFYGPNAEELGASFSADNAAGAALTGSMTGRRNGQAPVSLSLTDIVADTPLNERFAEFSTGTDTSLTPAFRGSIGNVEAEPGKVTLRQDGSKSVLLSNSAIAGAELNDAARSATQRPDFDSYDTVVNGKAIHVDLYKPGAANAELALTYAGFGIWTEPFQNGTFSQIRKDFFVYGFETPQSLLSRRTGSGAYDGIVYGATTTSDGILEDVGGTSHFDVDFGAQSYGGSLNLTARPASGGASSMLGTWTFSDKLVLGQMTQTRLLQNGIPLVGNLEINSIDPRFYGPDGEEIAATFAIQQGQSGTLGSRSITGVTVAKRH